MAEKRKISVCTESERVAFQQGYSLAILDVQNKGINYAKLWLRDLHELEKDFKDAGFK